MTREEAIVKSKGDLHRFYSGCKNFSDMVFSIGWFANENSWVVEKKVDVYFMRCIIGDTYEVITITEDIAKVLFKDIGYKHELANCEDKTTAITDIRHLMREFDIRKEDL